MMNIDQKLANLMHIFKEDSNSDEFEITIPYVNFCMLKQSAVEINNIVGRIKNYFKKREYNVKVKANIKDGNSLCMIDSYTFHFKKRRNSNA